jgi:16S rRNA G966 N2-methylase RsmD
MSDISVELDLKKHLGQYFSGHRVAKLLANLCKSDTALSIIDPMCGSGDMLFACSSQKEDDCNYVGVEIDKQVVQLAEHNLSICKNITINNSNAFDLKTLKLLSKNTFDLVITNPPYVRYQSFSSTNNEEENYLSSSQIRKNLIESLSYFKHLTKEEKETAREVISSYSGLSDMAVPSWILCSLLVKENGRIGLVVPNTWLNRNYADIIQYLLQKWFQIEYIIEDGNSSWFPSAQVKTTLLVARRLPQKETIFGFKEETFTFCSLYSSASSNDSLVGNISPGQTEPERHFVQAIDSGTTAPKHYSLKKIRLEDFSNNLFLRIKDSKWFQKKCKTNCIVVEENLRVKITSELSNWLGNGLNKFNLLEDIGVSVSQGLRTGANSFFYLNKEKELKEAFMVLPDKAHKQTKILIPKEYSKPVLRRQSELDNSFSIEGLNLSSILLYLQNAVLKRDINNNNRIFASYDLIKGDLERYIEEAEFINIGKPNEPKYYPELSAVKPNIRNPSASNSGELPRFWYMIPLLTKRHLPDLFIPRVNGKLPKTRMNCEDPIVIDANFSTIWISGNKKGYDKFSILALLNSSWCVVAMEEYGTVMGGGALKLEATQIKKIPIPILANQKVQELSALGQRLLKQSESNDSIIQRIDRIILESLNFEGDKHLKSVELNKIKDKLFQQRNG